MTSIHQANDRSPSSLDRSSSSISSAASATCKTATLLEIGLGHGVSSQCWSVGTIIGGCPRILLLVPTATYRASDFVSAAARLGVDVVVGSEHRQALSGFMGDRAMVVPLADVDAAVTAIVALHRRSPLDAVLAVDDQGVSGRSCSRPRT